ALVCDYNNYFKYGTTNNFVRVNGSIYNAGNFKGGGGFNTNSYFEDPVFSSATDLHSQNGCMTGVAITGITTDYDGDTRNASPSVGADEAVSRYISVVAILSPTGTSISGSQDVSFRVKNT